MTDYDQPPSRRLRALLEAPGLIELPGCYDVLSAMVLEDVGFPAVFLSGYGIAASFLGYPDIGLSTLTETSLIAGNIATRIRVPLVVDIDNGYGNAESVERIVRAVESAGAAGVILEDQVLPKRCGHSSQKAVIPLDDYLLKLRRALSVREKGLVVIARTDAADLDEGICRARAFQEAGADVTLIDGLQSRAALVRVGSEVTGFKVTNLIHGGKTPLLPASELAALGFKIVIYSTPALYVATQALRTSLAELRRTRDLASISPSSIGFSNFQAFMEERYAPR